MRFLITHNASSLFSRKRYLRAIKVYSSPAISFYDIIFSIVTPVFLLSAFDPTYSLIYVFLPIWIDCSFCTLLDWIVVFKIFQVTKSLIVRFCLLILYIVAPLITYIVEARPFVLILARYTDISIPSALVILNSGPLVFHFIPIILYLVWIMIKMTMYPINDPLKQKRRKKRREVENEIESEEEQEERSKSESRSREEDDQV